MESKSKGKVKFQKGKFDVKVNVTSSKVAGQYQMFTHDMDTFDEIIHVVANKGHQAELKVSAEPSDFEAFKVRTQRMISLMLAKKLAVSMAPDDNLRFGGLFNRIGGMEMYGPTSLVPVINGLGHIRENDVEFGMIGQPAVTFSYFCRAVLPDEIAILGENQVLNRSEDFFVNLAWPRPFDMLSAYCCGVINAWAESEPMHQVTIGGLPMECQLPKLIRGFAAYRGLLGNQIQRPLRVIRALTIGELIEDLDGPFAPEDIPAFALQNVRFVDLKQNDLTDLGGKYYDEVQSRVEAAFSSIFTWGAIRGFGDTGSTWQLVQKKTPFFAMSPIKIPSEQLAFGWMMAGNVAHITNTLMYSIQGEKTSREEKVEYVEGMFRGGKSKS